MPRRMKSIPRPIATNLASPEPNSSPPIEEPICPKENHAQNEEIGAVGVTFEQGKDTNQRERDAHRQENAHDYHGLVQSLRIVRHAHAVAFSFAFDNPVPTVERNSPSQARARAKGEFKENC